MVLTGSRVSGPQLRAVLDRRYLLRALQLGFRQVRLAGPSRPLLCRDENRTYLFMPLDAAAVLPPSPDALRVLSGNKHDTTPSERQGSPERRKPLMPSPTPAGPPHRNGDVRSLQSVTPAAASEPTPDPVAEAEALRELLQEAQGRLSRLLAALKQQRRTSRALQAAVQSLRHLRLDG